MLARLFLLKGQVQGVGFRYFVCRLALELGIQGWVRNLSTGEVEIHAQGSDEEMKKFQAQVVRGPSLAVVSEVRVREVELQSHSGFLIGR